MDQYNKPLNLIPQIVISVIISLCAALILGVIAVQLLEKPFTSFFWPVFLAFVATLGSLATEIRPKGNRVRLYASAILGASVSIWGFSLLYVDGFMWELPAALVAISLIALSFGIFRDNRIDPEELRQAIAVASTMFGLYGGIALALAP